MCELMLHATWHGPPSVLLAARQNDIHAISQAFTSYNDFLFENKAKILFFSFLAAPFRPKNLLLKLGQLKTLISEMRGQRRTPV